MSKDELKSIQLARRLEAEELKMLREQFEILEQIENAQRNGANQQMFNGQVINPDNMTYEVK